MKIGPVHVLRDETLRDLLGYQDLWQKLSGEIAAAAKRGNPLADAVLEQTHALMHSPLAARFAPVILPTDDAGDLRAAERVIAAYRKAQSDAAAPPTASMWDRIGAEQRVFLTALADGNAPAVSAALSKMFVNDLTWGLGQVHSSHPELLKSVEPTHLHFRFTDTLVNLAEAIGSAAITSMVQNAANHLCPLDRDLDSTYDGICARLGFDPLFPAVGAAFGFRVAGRLVTIDSLTHAYTAYRARQLAGGDRPTVYELGGGYGCLAFLAHRANVGRYAIFDLPWVNALQGYFLIRSLPAGSVRLYGEETGEVRVLPYWKLDDEPAKACDVLVNTDSLPEMGRETAAAYLPKIQRVARTFLSINQEAGAHVPGVGAQNNVRELVDEMRGFTVRSRQRAWMRQGYIEEVFEPI